MDRYSGILNEIGSSHEHGFEFAVCVLGRTASRRRNGYAYHDERELDLGSY